MSQPVTNSTLKNGVEKTPSLGICIPVWNRGEIFQIAFSSLIRQLNGVEASIWIYDNGSDAQTVRIVQEIQAPDNIQLIKTFFPQNMGIPYVTNVFLRSITEDCGFTGFTSPDYILIMDADAYFQRPVIDLIHLLEDDYSVGLVSGHDSIEHPAIKEMHIRINDRELHVKEKDNERMISMLMRKEEFIGYYPFSHYRNRDVDWEITQWSQNALKKRFRRLFVACDYVLHLGIHYSTWNAETSKLATEEEMSAVQKIMEEAQFPSGELTRTVRQQPAAPPMPAQE